MVKLSAERITRIRDKLAEARAKGALDSTTIDIMVITVGELDGVLEELETRRRFMALGEAMAESLGVAPKKAS